jgi:pilus assembly protein CpaC
VEENMKKYFLVLFILFAINIYSRSSSDVIKKSIVINVGTARVISLPFAPGEVLKGDKGDADIDPKTGEPGDLTPSNTIFEAKWKDKKVRIRGLAVGSGNLEVFDKRGKKRMIIWVYISTPKKGRAVRNLQKLLKGVEGVNVYVSGDDVTIDGELFRQKDRERIDEIVSKYSTDGVKIINLTVYSPIFMQAMAKKIQKEIGDPQIIVKPLRDKFMIKGQINYKTQSGEGSKDGNAAELGKAIEKAKRYYRIAEAYLGETNYVGSKESEAERQTIVEAIQLVEQKDSQQIDKQIRIQFDFVELAKSYMKKFGFSWAPGIYSGETNQTEIREQGLLGDMSTANVGSGGITATITGTIRNLIPKLHNAKQFGHAKVLETAQVITKNKTDARFDSKRKVLLYSGSDEGKALYEPIEFGLMSTYTPEIIEENNAINLKIDISYDTLPEGPIRHGSNIPNHKVVSELIIESGRSAAIAGMIKNVSAKYFDRIPDNIESSFLNIYHSKDFIHNKSQMIMFITPTIIEDSSSGSDRLKRKFRMK